MKAAITILSDSGRISPVFESAESLLFIQLCRSGRYRLLSRVSLPSGESEKILFLREHGIRFLLCGALSNETLEQLHGIGIRVLPFLSGTWEAVLEASLSQPAALPSSFIMPGCCGHHRRCCQHQGEKR